MRFLHY